MMRLATYGLLSSRADRRFCAPVDQRHACCYVRLEGEHGEPRAGSMRCSHVPVRTPKPKLRN